MSLLTLRTARLGLDLAPAAGGAIARFTVDGADILRPMAAADIASGKGNNGSSYPLVPFAGRIRDGRLDFRGEQIRLAPNWPGASHPLHGDGWANAWQVVRSDRTSAEISYLHERAGGQGGWPFRYRAGQNFRLEDDRLTIRMTLENLEDRPVPGGFGLHPYFLRDTDSELVCRSRTVWLMDADVMPIERVAVPPEWDFAMGLKVDEVALNTCFEGWDGRATLTWPQRRLRLDMAAGAPFGNLVLFMPAGERFFCVEPWSHGLGQADWAPLGPRATLEGDVVFQVTTL
ncbi:aldose 1-epimerase [Reyranella sp.]|uniref:aldose 1-epimerase n=1 Tax=Reyranella sp. TaxID=1929291 RepID=UPI003D11733C